MSSVAMNVDPAVLQRIIDWAADIDDFERHHAADGLFIAHGCRIAELQEDPEADFLKAIALAFWFWFDDRSDRSLCREHSPIDWEALYAFSRDTLRGRGGSTPEERYFSRMSAALMARAEHPDEHRFWALHTVRSLHGMHAEELASRAGQAPSFVECLESGAESSTMTSFMAAAYLAHGMNRPARHGDIALGNVERFMELLQRAGNDLYSADKERREGHAGRPSNLVLRMEQHLAPCEARAFVEEQRRGYERLMEYNLDLLGPDDPFARIHRATLASIRRWYALGPTRYSEALS
jgi:transcriptional regulator with XRE-family HTH domain